MRYLDQYNFDKTLLRYKNYHFLFSVRIIFRRITGTSRGRRKFFNSLQWIFLDIYIIEISAKRYLHDQNCNGSFRKLRFLMNEVHFVTIGIGTLHWIKL